MEWQWPRCECGGIVPSLEGDERHTAARGSVSRRERRMTFEEQIAKLPSYCTPEAIATAKRLLKVYLTPTTDGGIQIEIHDFGVDCEIEIGANGGIVGMYLGKAT